MQGAYPEMSESVQRVARVVKDEEHRYATPFSEAEKQFANLTATLNGGAIPGSVAFKLYDTYGFPIDLTQIIAGERGQTVDLAGFERALGGQRERSRVAGTGAPDVAVHVKSTGECWRCVAGSSDAIVKRARHEETYRRRRDAARHRFDLKFGLGRIYITFRNEPTGNLSSRQSLDDSQWCLTGRTQPRRNGRTRLR